jgi:hypothetical protein
MSLQNGESELRPVTSYAIRVNTPRANAAVGMIGHILGSRPPSQGSLFAITNPLLDHNQRLV